MITIFFHAQLIHCWFQHNFAKRLFDKMQSAVHLTFMQNGWREHIACRYMKFENEMIGSKKFYTYTRCFQAFQSIRNVAFIWFMMTNCCYRLFHLMHASNPHILMKNVQKKKLTEFPSAKTKVLKKVLNKRRKNSKSLESSAFFLRNKIQHLFRVMTKIFRRKHFESPNITVSFSKVEFSKRCYFVYLYFQIVRAKSVYVILAFFQGHLVLMVKVRNR